MFLAISVGVFLAECDSVRCCPVKIRPAISTPPRTWVIMITALERFAWLCEWHMLIFCAMPAHCWS
jgi:hypothetical protein